MTYYNTNTPFHKGGKPSDNLTLDNDGSPIPKYDNYIQFYNASNKYDSFISAILKVAPDMSKSKGPDKQGNFQNPNMDELKKLAAQYGVYYFGKGGSLGGVHDVVRNGKGVPKKGNWIVEHMRDLWKAQNDYNIALSTGMQVSTKKETLDKLLNNFKNPHSEWGHDYTEYIQPNAHRSPGDKH